MASKRHIRKKACTGKVRFDTTGQAFDRIRKIRKSNGARHPETLHPYSCAFCRGVHIGHRGTPSAANSALSQ